MQISFTILSIFSYLAILIKDVVIASKYGAGSATDAFFFVYQIMFVFLVILGGIGGPFYKTTVVLASGIVERPKSEIKTLINSFLTLCGVGFLVFGLLLFIFSPGIAGFIIPNATASFQQEVVNQLRILSPVIFLCGMSGILSGVINTYGKFMPNVLSPVLAGIAFISIVLLFGKAGSGGVLGFAMLAGVLVWLGYQVFNFISVDFGFKPQFNFSHPRFVIIRKMFTPVFITLLIGNLYLLVDMYFVSGFSRRSLYVFDHSGGWSELYYAYSLFLFVTVILSGLLAKLVFKEHENSTEQIYLRSLSNHYGKVLDYLLYLGIPVSIFIIIFAHDIVKFVYERGEFGSSATVLVTNLLMIFAMALLPFLAKTHIYKTYESLNSFNLPLYIAIAALVAKTGLNYVFVEILEQGVIGIAFSTLIVITAETVALGAFIKNKIKVDYEALFYLTIQIVPVTLATAVLIYLEKIYFDMLFPQDNLYLALKLLIYMVTGGLSYYVLSLPIKIYVAEELLKNIRALKPFALMEAEVGSLKAIIQNQSKDYEHLYKELVKEKDKSEKLLSNILPGHVAEELKETGTVKPVDYECATIMFADFEGFTRISKMLSKEQLVKELDGYYKLFDVICEKYELEKIKTIGDSYMCMGGVPIENKTHAIDSILAAFCFLIYMKKVKRSKEEMNLPSFNLRIGINSGSLVAGVVGSNKTNYDVWGDAVNLASRMESAGVPGQINISESTYELIKKYFDCSFRGEKEVKNAGLVKMYFVKGLKQEYSEPNSRLLPNEEFNRIYKELKSS